MFKAEGQAFSACFLVWEVSMDPVASSMNALSSQLQANQTASIYALKKAMSVQAEGALALLQALPQAQSVQYSNPPNLGKSVDVKV